jgi:diacylglycerol O-acyltransferase/trehalose O-mycolyltransferase
VRDLTIDSPALGRTAMVRLLLPRRFSTQPNRRWPVLWLLHGCCDTYQSWTRSTDVEHLAGLADVLVVMPRLGRSATTRTGTTLAATGRRTGRPST